MADGLRADSFYLTPETFLKDSIAKVKGTWGVSHTRVPTETRPGHVAMLAGFYEDVSAVTKGWKSNPVPYDHILNGSSQAWAWGASDTVTLFTKDIPHAKSFCYAPELEDFSNPDLTQLDTWVFDEVTSK